MAINSENARRSVSGYTGPVVLPACDARISAADRAHVAGIYSGLFSNIGVVSFDLGVMVLSRMETEHIALSTFSSEEIALSSMETEHIALSTFSDEEIALSSIENESLEN